MTEFEKEIVIPQEHAVFWMDAQGRWCNLHGPFEHPKIIAYFNHAIRRDSQGYFVEQSAGRIREKVYFRYADTPLFIVDILSGDPQRLLMNTGERVALRPQELFIAQDNLYLRRGDERIKFHERVLLKLAPMIEQRENRYVIRIDGVWRPIVEEQNTLG
jgi:hypothetical protein